jgi:PhnB protein
MLLLGSDTMPNQYQKPQGMMITIDVDDAPGADGIFNKLADGGSVLMPIQETFWAERFGMCVDRFGIPWMVNSMKPVAAAR